MAKAVVAALLCALLVATVAAETGRALLEETKFDCNGAKRISGVNNACNLLCGCAGALDKSLSGKKKDDAVARCKKTCEDCTSAGKSCKAGSPLPDACKEGTSNEYVKQCINTYLKSQG